MPRLARIDMPGLLQHVIARGVNRGRIFLSDDDRQDFIDRLDRLLKETNTICYAWSLLGNHFHLLLMPIERPLSDLMRRLLTGYAVSFNRRHDRVGHLFQNRYKSIVCDVDAYLMELVRYIHLNPVRSQDVKSLSCLADFPWTGHRQLIGKSDLNIITDSDVLSLFSRRKDTARKAYLEFLSDGLEKESAKDFSGGRPVRQMNDYLRVDGAQCDDRILGSGGFVERILGNKLVVNSEKSLNQIIELVLSHFEIDKTELKLSGQSRRIASAKAVICFIAIRHNRISGSEVAIELGYTRSGVSRAVNRGKLIFDSDEVVQKIFG